jgi:hypothetical protein
VKVAFLGVIFLLGKILRVTIMRRMFGNPVGIPALRKYGLFFKDIIEV